MNIHLRKFSIFILLLSGKTIGVRNYRFIGHPLILVHGLLGLSRVVTGEDKVNRWSSERRDQACSGYPEISCKREQSQACLVMPSAADIQRKLIVTEEDKVNPT